MEPRLMRGLNMLRTAIEKARGTSIKWKILVPFLLFSFIGITTLAYIGLSSQEKLIKTEEKKELFNLYHLFLSVLDRMKDQALSLSATIALNPQVQRLLADRDRDGLYSLMLPVFTTLKEEFGILLFHLYVPPGQSFLRLHMPDVYGEMVSYGRAVVEAMRTGSKIGGLEWGLAGLSIRGVVPIYHEQTLVGTVGIGYPLGGLSLAELKRQWRADFTVFEKKAVDLYTLVSTTLEMDKDLPPPLDLLSKVGTEPTILIAPSDKPDKSILFGSVRDYQGEVVAIVKIELDRTRIVDRLSRTRTLMWIVGATGLLVSFALTWLVALILTRPIKEIVKEAEEIAQGRRESSLHTRPRDEIGVLTHSLNLMLDALKAQRLQVEEYAKTLEVRVEERTADLVASEEKYRTLVDNLPLIVYRLLGDGTTEFINPYFSEKLGYGIDEVVGNRRFWREKIWGRRSSDTSVSAETDCWKEGKELKVERVIQDRRGQSFTFLDHAIPFKNANGKVKWIDGIMMDITELKMLQDRALRTEEIRVLGEISARFAHEVRNPLVAAGGFARRLRDALPQDDPKRKVAGIIVDEVKRLESILKIILSSLAPVDLVLSDVDLNRLLSGSLLNMKDQLKRKDIKSQVSLLPDLPHIQADEGLINRVFENLFKHALISMPEGETLQVVTSLENDRAVVAINHKMEALAEEDLEQFFLPRFAGKPDSVILDLPLSKIIIHRHGGTIKVSRKTGNAIMLRIELPAKTHLETPGTNEGA
jgi:PAS domain S-box-containing protein